MSDLFWLTDDQMARFFSAIRFRVTHTALAHDPTPARSRRGAGSCWKALLVPRQARELGMSHGSVYYKTVAVILAGLLPTLLSRSTGSKVMSRIAAPVVSGMLTAPLLYMLVTCGALTACGQKSDTTAPAAASIAATQSDPAAPPLPAGRIVKGVGVVTAVNAKAGTITLDHEAVPDAEWPAMTMSFSAPSVYHVALRAGSPIA